MENRFSIEKEKSGKMLVDTLVVVDKKTGVQYLYVASGYGGGVTAMLDADGKPLLAEGYQRTVKG